MLTKYLSLIALEMEMSWHFEGYICMQWWEGLEGRQCCQLRGVQVRKCRMWGRRGENQEYENDDKSRRVKNWEYLLSYLPITIVPVHRNKSWRSSTCRHRVPRRDWLTLESQVKTISTEKQQNNMEPFTCVILGVSLVVGLTILPFLWTQSNRKNGIISNPLIHLGHIWPTHEANPKVQNHSCRLLSQSNLQHEQPTIGT